MKIKVRGKGTVTLNSSDFKAGGEAKVWIKDSVVYKIYHEAKHMIPETKLDELKSLKKSKFLILPEDTILDLKDKPIGFTMIKAEGVPLVTLHTTEYQNEKGINQTHLIKLLENMKETVHTVHQQNFLMVDINELNIIVSFDWITPQFIDTNAWKTPSFPASAINPNIRDYSANSFSELTDWYSFAIITCHLFTGIHPFRGSHKNYKRGDVTQRMKDHISIFNPEVSLPKAVRNFNLIPSHYLKWYNDLFERGKRVPPPLLPGVLGAISVPITVIRTTNNFEIKFIKEFPNEILSHTHVFGKDVTKTKKEVWINKTNYRVGVDVDAIITPRNLYIMFIKIEGNLLKIKSEDSNRKISYSEMSAKTKMIINNTLYAISDNTINEISFTDLQNQTLISVSSSWDIMSNSEVFDGIIFQLIMGKPYIVIPVPRQGDSSLYIEKNIPELEGYKIINGRHRNGVAIITGFKDSKYDMFIFKFDESYQTYHCRKVLDVDLITPNFVVLDSGQTVSINSDENVELFFRNPAITAVVSILDPDVNGTMRLCKSGMEVRFFHGNNLYSIRRNKQ